MKTKQTFYQKVDRRSRAKMILFLTTHFRYWTMNSWNLSTSWANNLKIHKVIPSSLQDKVFELMETDDWGWDIRHAIASYEIEHNWNLQAGFNGRSGGYLVMYEGGKHADGHTFTMAGRRIDSADPFGYQEMNISDLVQIVKKVQRFDQLCDEIVQLTIDMAENCEVVEEEYTVTKTRKVIA